MTQKKLTDEDPMMFGKHKGTAMANVPADYLLYLYHNNLPDGNVRDYIEDNLDSIQQESANLQSKKGTISR